MQNIVLTLIIAFTTFTVAVSCFQVPAASAADIGQEHSWTGFTAGIQSGYAWNNRADFISGSDGNMSADFNGSILGGFAGYNRDLGNGWVAGLEADFDKNWGDGNAFLGIYSYGLDWQGSVRGRVGHAFDGVLVYGTAGWAYARSYTDVMGLDKTKETFNGYTIGVGADILITDMVIGRIEYRYTDFGSETFAFEIGTTDSDMDQHAIRAGLGVKF